LFNIKLLSKDLCLVNKKDILPAFQQSNAIYQLSCHCYSRYVGLTSQTLQDRIKQHIPKSIRNAATCSQSRSQPKRQCKSSTQVPSTQTLSCDSVIGLHLLRNPICVQNYDDKQFSILAEGRSPFHLSVKKPFSLKPQIRSFADKKNLSIISRYSRINISFVLKLPAPFI